MDASGPLFDRLFLWLDGCHAGPMNMAMDQAWLELAGAPMLRVYGWDAPTVSIGYAQNLAKIADGLPSWPVVRRWTGGGVVLHHQDHTYSVMVPAINPWAETRPVESYRLLHGSLAAALVDAGNPGCRLATADDAREAPFCFVAPAVHDVVRGQVKIAGAGQRRGKLGLLHQGSVQQVVLGPAFWLAWSRRLAREVVELDHIPAAITARAAELHEARYALPEWLADRGDLLG